MNFFTKVFRKIYYIILCISFFFFLNTFNEGIQGQEESDSTVWPVISRVKQLSSYDTEILNEKDHLLFVSTDCEGCINLFTDLESMQIQTFDIFFFDVSAYPESKQLLEDIYDLCEDIDVGIGTPFFYSEEECYTGYIGIRDRVSSLIVREKEGLLYEDDFDFLEAYRSSLEREEFLNKSLGERLSDSTQLWEWIVLGFTVVLGIGFLIYWIVNRGSVGRKEKTVFTILQIFLFLLPTAYLGIKVNTAINLGREYSRADGDDNCALSNTCATWADLMEARATMSTEDATYYNYTSDQINQAQSYVESNGGSGSAQYETVKNTQLDQVKTASQALMDISKNEDGTVNWSQADFYKDVIGSAGYSVVGNEVVIINSKGEEEKINVSQITAISPRGVYLMQLEELGLLESSTATDLDSLYKLNEQSLYLYNQGVIKNYNEKGEVDDLYQWDSVTGQIIKTSVDMAIIDDFCIEPSGGGGSAGGCYCDNGKGSGVYTPASPGASCDAICRVRNLVCEDCNPAIATASEGDEYSSYDQPPPPPPSGGPYCGDGILGNTSGEECEYRDPSGVQCSWYVCDSSCKCPTETNPFCGDGNLDPSEQCELNNPSGVQCNWLDACNKINCLCIKPGCGDGNLDSGEQCERDNPTGVQCLWDEECNQTQCSCKIEQSPSCGDGILQEGELCEEGNPSGSQCDWTICSKYTCICPSSPHTAIFDEKYGSKITVGIGLILLGIVFRPLVSLINHSYIKLSDGIITIGRYVDQVEKDIKKKKKQNIMRIRREKIEKRFK